MADTTDNDAIVFRNSVLGVISGFDSIDLGSDQAFEQLAKSLIAVEAELQSLNANYSVAVLKNLKAEISRHIKNYNNPHKDDIESLANEGIALFLQTYIPGAVPSSQPTYSLQPFMEALGGVFSSLTCVRDSEIVLTGQQGGIVGYAVNELAIDWSNGVPRIPVFNDVNQLITNPTDQISQGVGVNTTLSFSPYAGTETYPKLFSQGNSSGVTEADFNYALVAEEDEKDVSRGVAFTPTYETTTETPSEYTTSVYVYPLQQSGTIVFQSGNDYYGIDIASKSVVVTSSTGSITPSVFALNILPNGWWRISMASSYLPTTFSVYYSKTVQTTPVYLNFVTGAQDDAVNAILQYIGTGVNLFAHCLPNVTDTPLAAPPILTQKLAASTYTATLSGNVPSYSAATMVFRFLTGTPSRNINTETNLSEMVSIGGASLSMGKTTGITAIFNDSTGTQMFTVSDSTANPAPGYAISAAASYGLSTSAIQVDSDNVVTGTGKAVDGGITNISKVTLYPFDGYVYELTLYPTGETSSSVLNFLVGKK